MPFKAGGVWVLKKKENDRWVPHHKCSSHGKAKKMAAAINANYERDK